MADTSRQYIRLFMLAALLMLATACGSIQSTLDNAPAVLDIDLASQGTLYTNEWVHRQAEPQIMVRPQEPPDTPPRVLFVPFRMYQDMREGSAIAEQVSGIFWQSWLQQRTFEVLQFAPELAPFSPARGIAAGRAAGADLVVSGYVTRFIDAGTAGDSRLALQVDMYDTFTGELVWSMAHAGFMENTVKRDYLLFTQRNRLPAEPVWSIATVLAADMARPIKEWQAPLQEEEPDPFAPAPLAPGQMQAAPQPQGPVPQADAAQSNTIYDARPRKASAQRTF
jgi:hypothetical protein